MSQMSFSDFEYAGKRKKTRRERFLVEMEVVPWAGLVALIEPHYPKAGGGRKPYPPETMLRIHLLQKAHIGADVESGLANHVHGTAANVADVTQVAELLHGEENAVYADAGYTGVEKREEHAGRDVIWQIAARRSTYSTLPKRSLIYKGKRRIERAKADGRPAQTRAKVEHPFRAIKRQFGYVKTRFHGLVKNTAQLTTLFALSNM
jgi:IS5 family transposase